MRPPVPLPTAPPFVSLYTPTFRRPQALVRNIESVARQTAREHVEQVIVPDHVGHGIAWGLFGRIKWYAPALRGLYVAVVADDDHLAADDVVAKVKAFAEAHDFPEVIVVRAVKNGFEYPTCQVGKGGPPLVAEVDLCCYIVRSDVFARHAADYGARYEGDFDHAKVLYDAGYRHEFCDVLWVDGAASNGRPETDWP